MTVLLLFKILTCKHLHFITHLPSFVNTVNTSVLPIISVKLMCTPPSAMYTMVTKVHMSVTVMYIIFYNLKSLTSFYTIP